MWEQQDQPRAVYVPFFFPLKKKIKQQKKKKSLRDFSHHLFNTEQTLLFGIVVVTSHVLNAFTY